MNKKILISAIVIISGLMLGAIFSNSFSEKNEGTGSDSQPITNSTQTASDAGTSQSAGDNLVVKLRAEKTTINRGAATKDNFANIDKAPLVLEYTNKTLAEISGLQASVRISGKNKAGISSGSPQIKLVEDLNDSGYRIFDIPQVARGTTQKAQFFLFAPSAGTNTVEMIIRNKEGIKVNSNSVTINVQ